MNTPDPRLILDTLPFGVVVWHAPTDDPADLVLTYSNDKTQQESGFDARQMVGRRMGDAMPAALEFWGPTFLEVIRSGDAAVVEAPFADENHPYRVHRVQITPIGDRSVVAINENVTATKRAETQREMALAQLAASNAELERFAGAVAHDLKSPLSVIQGFADLLPRVTELDDQAADMADRISRSARRAAGIINDLLDYARHAGTSSEREMVDLADVVGWAVQTLATDVEASDATLVIDDLPSVYANESALRQVFLNLLQNALKYARPGHPPRIRVWAVADREGLATITVDDDGIGIPLEHRRSVFELGSRVHTDIEGTGIGLASCKVVLQHHGGTIWVDEPEDGKGTTIRLTIPRQAPLVSDDEPVLRGPLRVTRRGTVTLMVVDDDADTRELLRVLTRGTGVEIVAEANDGAMALEQYRQLDHRPDVVLVDYRLPGMDGIEVARQILGQAPDQPIVLRSAHLTDELRARANDVGIAACTRKLDQLDLPDLVQSLVAGDDV